MIQLFIAIFGLTAMWLALGKSERGRKWAPIFGLIGQPFWFAFALQSEGWGLMTLTVAYTGVYLRGAWIHWKKS